MTTVLFHPDLYESDFEPTSTLKYNKSFFQQRATPVYLESAFFGIHPSVPFHVDYKDCATRFALKPVYLDEQNLADININLENTSYSYQLLNEKRWTTLTSLTLAAAITALFVL